MKLGLVVACVAWVGCVQSSGVGGPPVSTTCPAEADCVLPCAPDCPGPVPPSSGVAAPVLVSGTAWSYEGVQEYDVVDPFTVVVSLVEGGGSLFLAGAEDDLLYHVRWGDRWFGPRDASLNPEGRRSFSWPLVDGASWEYVEGRVVTASAVGAVFVIEGGDDRFRMRYVYDPAVGAISEWRTTLDGVVVDDVRLARVGVAGEGVWFEAGDLVAVTDPASPQVFDVGGGLDAVVVSAGGKDGARVTVTPPGGEPWMREFAPSDDPVGSWVHAALPATEGRWTASLQGWPGVDAPLPEGAPRPVGWSWLHLVPVAWTRVPT